MKQASTVVTRKQQPARYQKISGVNFTKLCLASKKSPAYRVWQKNAIQFQQQNLGQICVLKFAKSVRRLSNTIPQKSFTFRSSKKVGQQCW
jgi:hypothetical protein